MRFTGSPKCQEGSPFRCSPFPANVRFADDPTAIVSDARATTRIHSAPGIRHFPHAFADFYAVFFRHCMSRISARSRTLPQGATHASRSFRKRQCPRHWLVPNSTGSGRPIRFRAGGDAGAAREPRWNCSICARKPAGCSRVAGLGTGGPTGAWEQYQTRTLEITPRVP